MTTNFYCCMKKNDIKKHIIEIISNKIIQGDNFNIKK
jgi:hypothetical protein